MKSICYILIFILMDDLGKKQAKTRKTLDGIVSASKGKGNENTDHCKKYPDAC